MIRTGLTIAVACLFADITTKQLLHNLLFTHSITLTPFLDLVLIWNRGISFGIFNSNLFQYQPEVISLISVIIVCYLGTMLCEAQNYYHAIAIGMIMGGAIGNVYDRITYGAVRDFFYFHIGSFYWPAFNVADATICIGVMMLLFHLLSDKAKS